MIKWIKNNYKAIIIWAFFELVAVISYLTTKNLFYLLNFSYIATCITVGSYLYMNNIKYARNVVQFAVGLYMLIYLGIISNENMQIEGFWYYLFLGVFEAAVIHYLVAKIIGPIIFGRGWCGYACWTGMILDLLPYKVPKEKRKKLGFIRYITFSLSFIFVAILFIFKFDNLSNIMFWAFIIGNFIDLMCVV